MGNFVGANVPSLGEAFLAYVAGEGFLSCMAPLMGLYRIQVNRLSFGSIMDYSLP